MPISSVRPEGTTTREGFSGILAEADHVRGQPVHRPHEQIVQREIDQRRGDRRDQQREQQDVAREAEHRLRAAGPSSITISMKSVPGGPCPTTRITSVSEQKSSVLQRIPNGAHRGWIAQVDVVMDLMRHVVDGEQLALVAHLDRHGLGAEAVENLLDHVLGQLEFVRLARNFGSGRCSR